LKVTVINLKAKYSDTWLPHALIYSLFESTHIIIRPTKTSMRTVNCPALSTQFTNYKFK